MKRPIKNNVSWVGKIDWDSRTFHGDEYTLEKGTSFNSYLIEEEKTVLIDTVWKPYEKEFIDNLSKEIDLKKIDFIVINHAEIDHSGSLPALMELIPDTPIYCTANGVKSLTGHFHKNWNFKVVKTGDRVSLGNGKELIFFAAPMLHWPDTLFTYMTGDNILFSTDGFGQHYASEKLFNDLVDQHELYTEALKYYANILALYSSQVDKKVHELLALNLPLDMICTSHGVIWRDNPMQIVNKYLEWSHNYQENQITLIYDTMWNGTRILAENIAQGIREVDPVVTVKLFNSANTDKTELIGEVFKSKAILVGSPTVNKGILSSTALILELIHGCDFKNKKAAAFGCFGWASTSVEIISNHLRKAGFEIVSEGIKASWNPDETAQQQAIQFGKDFVSKL